MPAGAALSCRMSNRFIFGSQAHTMLSGIPDKTPFKLCRKFKWRRKIMCFAKNPPQGLSRRNFVAGAAAAAVAGSAGIAALAPAVAALSG